MMWMATDLKSGMIYIIERPQYRSGRLQKRLLASIMPARLRQGDRRIALRSVPLYMRRAAREALQ
jgi:hypothetical protein